MSAGSTNKSSWTGSCCFGVDVSFSVISRSHLCLILVFPRTPFPKEGDCIPLTPPAPHVHPSHSLRSHSSLRREVKASHPKQGRTTQRTSRGNVPCQLYSDVGWREIFGSYSEGSEEGALPPNPRWGENSPDPCLLRLPVPPKKRGFGSPQPLPHSG